MPKGVASPLQSRAEGQGLRVGSARTTAEFTIFSYDEAGNRLRTGGDTYYIQARGPSSVTHTITDHHDGSYTCAWMSKVSGKFTIVVLLQGQQIVGSPFTVQVLQGRADASSCCVRGNVGKQRHEAVAGQLSFLEVEFCDALGAPSAVEELAVKLEETGETSSGTSFAHTLLLSDGTVDQDMLAIEHEERRLEAELMQLTQQAAAVSPSKSGQRGFVRKRGGLAAGGAAANHGGTGFELQGVDAAPRGDVHLAKIKVTRAGRYQLFVGLVPKPHLPGHNQTMAIPGSPVHVTVVAGPAAAETTDVSFEGFGVVATGASMMPQGRTLSCVVGVEGRLSFQAKDRFGNLAVRGGARFKVAVRPADGKAGGGGASSGSLLARGRPRGRSGEGELSPTKGGAGGGGGTLGVRSIVDDHDDGSYALRWRGEVCGAVQLHVTLDEKPLVGSPLSLLLSPAPLHPTACELEGPGVTAATAGSVALIRIHCRDAFGNAAPAQPTGVSFGVRLYVARPTDPGDDGDDDDDDDGDGDGDGGGGGGDGGLAEVAGAVEGVACVWHDASRCEVRYTPLRSGDFVLVVYCVGLAAGGDGDVDGGAGTAATAAILGSRRRMVRVAPGAPTTDACVASFVLEEDGETPIDGEVVEAGTPLLVSVQLRDGLGNPSVMRDPGQLRALMHLPEREGGRAPAPAPAAAAARRSRRGELSDPTKRAVVLRASEGAVGRFEGVATPSAQGRYQLVVSLGGEQLPDTPCHFDVVAGPPAGSHSKLDVAPLPKDAKPSDMVEGEERSSPPPGGNFGSSSPQEKPSREPMQPTYCLHVRTYDSFRNAARAGGTHITVKLSGPGKATSRVVDLRDGTYRVLVATNQSGEYVAHVFLEALEGGSAEELDNSPHTFTVSKKKSFIIQRWINLELTRAFLQWRDAAKIDRRLRAWNWVCRQSIRGKCFLAWQRLTRLERGSRGGGGGTGGDGGGAGGATRISNGGAATSPRVGGGSPSPRRSRTSGFGAASSSARSVGAKLGGAAQQPAATRALSPERLKKSSSTPLLPTLLPGSPGAGGGGAPHASTWQPHELQYVRSGSGNSSPQLRRPPPPPPSFGFGSMGAGSSWPGGLPFPPPGCGGQQLPPMGASCGSPGGMPAPPPPWALASMPMMGAQGGFGPPPPGLPPGFGPPGSGMPRAPPPPYASQRPAPLQMHHLGAAPEAPGSWPRTC